MVDMDMEYESEYCYYDDSIRDNSNEFGNKLYRELFSSHKLMVSDLSRKLRNIKRRNSPTNEERELNRLKAIAAKYLK